MDELPRLTRWDLASGSDEEGRIPHGVRPWWPLGASVKWHPSCVASVYEAAGGEAGLLRLAEAWHARVLADEVVSHAFSHGFNRDHVRRLAAYWGEALGGPATYSERYADETFVVRLHSGNGIHEDMDRRAIECFDRALEDAGIGADEGLTRTLHDYFKWATTVSMSRYPRSPEDVPAGLAVARWSWDGLQPD